MTSGRWPSFLPDGRRFLFARFGEGIWAGSVATGDMPRQICRDERAEARLLNGHLMFVRDRTLLAQRFNLDTLKLSGEAFPIAELLPGSLIDDPGGFGLCRRPAGVCPGRAAEHARLARAQRQAT